VGIGSHTVSSSAIRAFLQAGHVEKAAKALGYPYEMSGRVIPGDHRGRALGFPTANLDVDAGKILPPGVFWVSVEPLGLEGLCNIGMRPTFTPGETKTHVEVFLFGHPGRLYGRRLRVRFLRRVRGEKRFASSAALVRQIRRDVERVRRWEHSAERTESLR
jgi:riboflavin kinase/FMN adenylyltransferase